MLRLRYAGLAGVLFACSPVKDTSNVPDAPIDSTDMRAPMIESSNPPNMGTKVSVLQPISVFFDEALDPASVSATTVKLGYDERILPPFMPNFGFTLSHGPVPDGLTQIDGMVSYDPGAKKVSFVPAAPLPYGVELTLSLDVKDKAGLAFTGKVTFMTYVNLQTRQYYYNASNLPSSWIGINTDMMGRQTKRIGSSAPGTDTIWFTSDDPKNQRYDFKSNPDGRMIEERAMNAGADGLYDTPDDTLSVCMGYRYNAEKQITERTYSNTPGPDTMPCTGDDIPAINHQYTYMGSTLTGFLYVTQPGTDGTWRTSDDKCAIYWEYEYDATTKYKKREVYKQCGTDGFAKTADDSISYYYEYEYDAKGRVTRNAYRTSGPNGMWFDADDGYGLLYRTTRNAQGLMTEQLYSTSAGTDNMWGTADDGGQRTTWTYNAQGLPEDQTIYNIGADNMWGTADDVISYYITTTYDVNGNRIDAKQWAAGNDGMFKTPDDRVSVDYDYDVSR